MDILTCSKMAIFQVANLMKNNHNMKIIFLIIFLFNNDFHLGKAEYYHYQM